MIIRDAFANEVANIRAGRVKSYEEHKRSIPEEHWNALKQAISSKADSLPGVEIIVAELDGEIVGSVVLFPAKMDAYEGAIDELDYPEIRMLAVAPEMQGKGIASALVSECIKRTKARGYQAIGLHTGQFMEGAMRLYERLGFERQPQFDFEPADDGIIVKAYRLAL